MQEATITTLKEYLPEYLARITEPDRRAGHNMYKCPLCGSGSQAGISHNGALSMKDSISWKCFACGKGGDIFTLIKLYEGLDTFPEQVKRAAELFGVVVADQDHSRPRRSDPGRTAAHQTEKKPEPGRFLEYITTCAAEADHTDYFKSRGFTPGTVRRFMLGYDKNIDAVVIPYDKSGSYYTTRGTKEKTYRKPPSDKAGAEPVFNRAALYGEKPCYICEGQIDAISIMQAGGTAAAVGGSGTDKLYRQIMEKKPEKPLILCFDNDEPGRKATEAAAAMLKEAGVLFTTARFTLEEYGAEHKDANDLLRANETLLRREIKENNKRAMRLLPFIEYDMGDYITLGEYELDIEYFKKYRNRKAGFYNLDNYLTLYPGMMAIGGSASIGKTTFCVNLADNLIKQGETVLYFSLEQEPIEISTKIIARRIYQQDPTTKITNIGLKNGETSDTLDNLRLSYMLEVGKRMKVIRCNFDTQAEDIQRYVESYILKNHVRPVVFVDYLQLIAPPPEAVGDQRLATDHALKLLKRMQLENELFVVIVSSFNRNAPFSPVGYEAFKETGMIEYTCDYVIGLQLAIMESEDFYTAKGSRGGEKETNTKKKRDEIHKAISQDPKEVELVSLKNRNGKQVYKCFFKYYMQHDAFIPDNNSPYSETGIRTKEEDPMPEDPGEEVPFNLDNYIKGK